MASTEVNPIKVSNYEVSFGKALKLSDKKKVRGGSFAFNYDSKSATQKFLNHHHGITERNKDIALLSNDKIQKIN